MTGVTVLFYGYCNIYYRYNNTDNRYSTYLIIGIIILTIRLYFGTLGRDFVDRLSDKMATTMGMANH
jgi:hypothetical protein